MEASFSPIVRKITAEVLSRPRRSSTSPTEVCLEDWWLSVPENGKGIGVSGVPTEIRECEDVQRKFSPSPVKRKYRPSREFNSKQIARRHGCKMVETYDGVIISFSSFINKARTLKNGFASEVCRDFIYGFPFNWDDHALGKESRQSSLELTDDFISDVLENYNGAQLHNFMLSLTDMDRGLFSDKIYENLMHILNSQAEDGVDVQSSTI